MHANPGVNRLLASDSRLFAFIRGSRLAERQKLSDGQNRDSTMREKVITEQKPSSLERLVELSRFAAGKCERFSAHGKSLLVGRGPSPEGILHPL